MYVCVYDQDPPQSQTTDQRNDIKEAPPWKI